MVVPYPLGFLEGRIKIKRVRVQYVGKDDGRRNA
jgi:hypothetical protein